MDRMGKVELVETKGKCPKCGGGLYEVPVANAGQRIGLFKRVPSSILVCEKCQRVASQT